MYKVVVFCSGGGGNLRALLNSQNHNHLFSVVKVIVDRDCGALLVSDEFGIPALIMENPSSDQYIELIPTEVSLIVLAGYLSILPASVCEYFSGKIINIHPSLLPKFGGKGMFGVNVHRAVLAESEKLTGCTIHYVSPGIDQGRIISQKRIEIPDGIDAWSLGGLVFDLEIELLPEVVSQFARGEVF